MLILVNHDLYPAVKGAVDQYIRDVAYEGDTFDHFPRRMNFQWDLIGLDSVVSNIEIDAFGARVRGKWAAEANLTWLVSGALSQNVYEHLFVGAQWGRWRVRAKVGGRTCPWSDWRYFRFTV